MRQLMFICLLLITITANAQECLIGGVGKEYKKACEKRGILCGKPNNMMYSAKFLTSTVCAVVNDDDIITAVTSYYKEESLFKLMESLKLHEAEEVIFVSTANGLTQRQIKLVNQWYIMTTSIELKFLSFKSTEFE